MTCVYSSSIRRRCDFETPCAAPYDAHRGTEWAAQNARCAHSVTTRVNIDICGFVRLEMHIARCNQKHYVLCDDGCPMRCWTTSFGFVRCARFLCGWVCLNGMRFCMLQCEARKARRISRHIRWWWWIGGRGIICIWLLFDECSSRAVRWKSHRWNIIIISHRQQPIRHPEFVFLYFLLFVK